MGSNRQQVDAASLTINLESEQGRNAFNAILKKHFDGVVGLEKRKTENPKYQMKKDAQGRLK